MLVHPRLTHRLSAACALSILLTVTGSAAAETDSGRSDRVRLALDGVEPGDATMCGKPRPTMIALHQQPLAAAVEITKPRAIRRARLVVARCEDGSWRRTRAQSFLPSRRYTLPLDTSRTGDYRLRALATDRRRVMHRSQFSYLRVKYPTSLTARIEASEPGANLTYSPLFPVYAHPGQTMVKGTLSSPSADCVDDRFLAVYRTDSGHDRQVATGRSYLDGTYEIDLGPTSQAASGEYYVHAPARGSCWEAKSPTVTGG